MRKHKVINENNWTNVKDKLPDLDIDVEISYDQGKTCFGHGKYTEIRHCMLAGGAGGNGHFGKGWATALCENIDNNLIIDDPTHWRESEES